MSFLKALGIAVLGGLVVLAGLLAIPGPSKGLGGGVSYDASYLVGDVYNGLSQVLMMRDGVLVGPVSSASLTIGSGTAIDLFKCTGATSWNPAAVTTTSIASATTSLSGAVLGDKVIQGFATTTQGLDLFAYISSTGVVTYQLSQPDVDAASVDIATTTIDVCVVST